MKSFTLLPLGLAAITTAVTGSVLPRDKQSVRWGPCSGFESIAPIECGNLTVPLDYTNPNSTETLQLELLRIPATKKPSKGSIFINFGGPGAPGRLFMASLGPNLQGVLGGYHDLISWDTRGTGNAMPFSCYASPAERNSSLLSSPVFSNASDVALGRLWAESANYALACQNANGEIGGLIGTAFTARDLMEIVDAVEDDGLLRYWGISYGTVLGATVAAMFPDRMDRVVIDGVQNPHLYYHGFDEEMVDSSDATWDEFFKGCLAAGRANCALARDGATYEQLRETVYDLMHTLKYDPLPLAGMLVDYTAVKAAIIASMYRPVRWPALAAALDGLLTGNFTPLLAFASGEGGGLENEATQGIRCSDKTARVSKRADMMPAIQRFAEKSRLFGDFWTLVEMQCAQWKLPAKEVYRGDFKVKTKHPILVVGNTWDPLTPLVSARNASATFEGSGLLEQRGHGHASIAEPSACTARVLQAYFVNGTLPDKGKVCEVDVKLFQNGASGAAIGKWEAADDDPRLLKAAQDLSLAWSRRRFV